MQRVLALALTAMSLLLVATPAQAYIGPGAGVTAIGTVVAFVGAVFFAIAGFVWYPIKRLLRALRGKGSGNAPAHKVPSA